MAKTSSSPASCSTSKRPASTPATPPASSPPSQLAPEVLDSAIRDYTRKLALSLNVLGLVNIQFAIQRGTVFVIEVNPRASRTVPYVSKATGVPLAKDRLPHHDWTHPQAELLPDRARHRQRPRHRRPASSSNPPSSPGASSPASITVLGPEMRSTGEVMGVADNFGEAFAKAQIAAGQTLPRTGTVFLSVNEPDKRTVAAVARRFINLGFKLVATHGTADILEDAGVHVERVFAVGEGRPNVVDLLKGDRIQLVVNTPRGHDRVFDEQALRRAAVLARIPAITTLAAARAAADGIEALQKGQLNVESLQALHAARLAQ